MWLCGVETHDTEASIFMTGRLFSCRNQRGRTHASLIRKSAASCRMAELPAADESTRYYPTLPYPARKGGASTRQIADANPRLRRLDWSANLSAAQITNTGRRMDYHYGTTPQGSKTTNKTTLPPAKDMQSRCREPPRAQHEVLTKLLYPIARVIIAYLRRKPCKKVSMFTGG
ncbi:hypothetical protein CBL_01951 [Carabus blaptoides fortunei]